MANATVTRLEVINKLSSVVSNIITSQAPSTFGNTEDQKTGTLNIEVRKILNGEAALQVKYFRYVHVSINYTDGEHLELEFIFRDTISETALHIKLATILVRELGKERCLDFIN